MLNSYYLHKYYNCSTRGSLRWLCSKFFCKLFVNVRVLALTPTSLTEVYHIQPMNTADTIHAMTARGASHCPQFQKNKSIQHRYAMCAPISRTRPSICLLKFAYRLKINASPAIFVSQSQIICFKQPIGSDCLSLISHPSECLSQLLNCVELCLYGPLPISILPVVLTPSGWPPTYHHHTAQNGTLQFARKYDRTLLSTPTQTRCAR